MLRIGTCQCWVSVLLHYKWSESPFVVDFHSICRRFCVVGWLFGLKVIQKKNPLKTYFATCALLCNDKRSHSNQCSITIVQKKSRQHISHTLIVTVAVQDCIWIYFWSVMSLFDNLIQNVAFWMKYLKPNKFKKVFLKVKSRTKVEPDRENGYKHNGKLNELYCWNIYLLIFFTIFTFSSLSVFFGDWPPVNTFSHS